MYKKFIKRVIDIFIALMAVPIFLLILFVIGPMIYLEDKGPIFYKSYRLGKSGKVYKMYKFRSMKAMAPDLRNKDGSTFNADNDPRLTRVGKFIRKTSIDETPQVLNILKNDMSIIGPRPDLPEHIKYYDSEEKRKLEVLPGITGYNQAFFRNSVEWKERLRNDVYYVDNISFGLDVKIFFKTIERILSKRGIYVDSMFPNTKDNASMSEGILGRSFECIPLKWDTDYFYVKSARVNLTGVVDEQIQNQILEFSKKFDFITIWNFNNIKENNYWLGCRTNAFMTDLNIQFIKVLEDKLGYQYEHTYTVKNLDRNEKIIEIARNAFQYSRFFNDPKLPQIKAKNIYLHWTECAFNKDNKYFTICERQGQIAGFVLFSLNSEEDSGVIELIAVDKKNQGQGVGKSLISEMESFVRNKGIKKIKVGTQVDNISAAQFYSKLGFKYISCGSVYHLWAQSCDRHVKK